MSPIYKLQVESSSTNHGLAITKGANVVAALSGSSGTGDDGTLGLYTGGSKKVQFTAVSGVINYINNGGNLDQ